MDSTNNTDIILGKDMSNAKRGIAFFSIALIYFFYCYNFMIGTFIKPTMIADVSNGGFGFTLTESEAIFAIMSLGSIPGTFIFGWLSTRIGKKKSLMLIAILIGVTTFIPILSPTNLLLWKVARCVTGLVLGGVFGCAMPLVADMFQGKYRGKLAATLTSLFSLAMIFGGWLYGVLGDANWQLLILTAVIPPVIGAILVGIFVPDDSQYTKELLEEGKKSGEKISYLSMYKGKYLWIGIGVILLSGANFAAYDSFANISTTYLVNTLGMTAVVAGAVFSVQGVGQLLGYYFWGTIADKFGRKVPLIGMAISAVLVFVYTTLNADSIMAFYIVSFFLGMAVGYSGAWGAYYTELFPSKFRAMSAGISFNGGRIISAVAIPMLATAGSGASGLVITFYLIMGIYVAGAIVWMFLPETLNKTK